ncbi:MAG: hypothetical protein LBS57_11225, partial [Treponema sp.]|nr:hypothetical protein [Treponema sp.]
QIVRRNAGVIPLAIQKFEGCEYRIDAHTDNRVFPNEIFLCLRQFQNGILSENPCRQDNQQRSGEEQRDIYTAGQGPERHAHYMYSC